MENKIENINENIFVFDDNINNGNIFVADTSTLILKLYDDTIEDSIMFKLSDKEMIKISHKGFYIKGKLVNDDNEIYNEFKKWINQANDNNV